MRKAFMLLSLVAILTAMIAGCGSSDTTMSINPPLVTGTVPVSFSAGDDPPTGVTILRFQVQITGASLQPADMTQPAVPMLTGPSSVELLHLQTETALLGNRNVPAATYSGLTATFANPQMTLFNQTSQTITVGTTSCPSNQVCMVSPALNQSSVTVQGPTAPFPLTLTNNSPLALVMHFDVNTSVQGDLSVTPSIVLNQILPQPNTGATQMFHLVGIVGAINAPMFTLQAGFGSVTSQITTNANTQYDFGKACTADSFSCLVTGQVVRVDLELMPGGTLIASKVDLLGPQNQPVIEGTVISVNPAQNQFQVVLMDLQGPVASVSFGWPLKIQVNSATTYGVDTGGLTLPAGVSFSTLQDVMVGQILAFHPVGPAAITGTGPIVLGTFSTDAVTLEDSEVTGTVSALNLTSNPPNFVLGNLPPLFTRSGITQIEVVPAGTAVYQTATGLSAIMTGDKVSVGGLLFNTSGTPTFFALRVFDRN